MSRRVDPGPGRQRDRVYTEWGRSCFFFHFLFCVSSLQSDLFTTQNFAGRAETCVEWKVLRQEALGTCEDSSVPVLAARVAAVRAAGRRWPTVALPPRRRAVDLAGSSRPATSRSSASSP